MTNGFLLCILQLQEKDFIWSLLSIHFNYLVSFFFQRIIFRIEVYSLNLINVLYFLLKNAAYGMPCDRYIKNLTRIPSSQGEQPDGKDRLNRKTSKIITQAKLTSLYGNNITKANTSSHRSSINSKTNNGDECMVIERAQSYHNHSKGHGISTYIKIEEEERGHGNALGSKRSHEEISSPKNDNAKSPSSNEEANTDVSGNGFVTARAKLVSIKSSKTKVGKKLRLKQ